MRKRKNKSTGAFYICVIAAIIGILLYNSYFKKDTPENNTIIAETTPNELSDISKEGIQPDSYIFAVVSRIVDGDTIIVYYMKDNYRVRLLDIDTPESVKEGVPVQMYAKEALHFTSKNLLNQKVKLVFEKSIKDKYGRLLAHIILKNNNYFNAVLVRMGYARMEILKPNDKFGDYFYKLQEQAIKEKIGVWSLKGNENPFIKNNYGEYIPRYWNENMIN